MKTFKKFLVLSAITITVLSSSPVLNAFADTNKETVGTSLINKDAESSVSEILSASQIIENYFQLKEGQVVLNVSSEELSSELNISLSDAQAMIDATKEINLYSPQPRGFVGVYINLGPKVRGMNGWAAGAFVGGYVGWYAKQFAAGGPVGVGVAAVITAGAAATAKWAVENGVRRIKLGSNIVGLNWNYTINIP